MCTRLWGWHGIEFSGYETLNLISVFVCLVALASLLRMRRQNLAQAIDLTILMVLGYYLLARLLFVLMAREWTFFTEFGVSKWVTGFWGGQIGFAVLAGLYLTFSRAPFAPLADALAVSWAAITVPHKLGCFLAGCCHGSQTSLPWALTFPAGSMCGLAGRPIHPTQLYDAGAALLIAIILLVAFLRRAQEGRLILWWGLLYSIAKFASEWTRGDRRFSIAGSFTTAMAVEVTAALACLVLIVYRRPWHLFILRRDRRTAAAPSRGDCIPGGTRFGMLLGNLVLAAALAAAAASFVGGLWAAVIAFPCYYLAANILFLRLRLVDLSGRSVGLRRLGFRAVVDALAPATVIGLFRPLLDTYGRSLGDACAGTCLTRGTISKSVAAGRPAK